MMRLFTTPAAVRNVGLPTVPITEGCRVDRAGRKLIRVEYRHLRERHGLSPAEARNTISSLLMAIPYPSPIR